MPTHGVLMHGKRDRAGEKGDAGQGGTPHKTRGLEGGSTGVASRLIWWYSWLLHYRLNRQERDPGGVGAVIQVPK